MNRNIRTTLGIAFTSEILEQVFKRFQSALLQDGKTLTVAKGKVMETVFPEWSKEKTPSLSSADESLAENFVFAAIGALQEEKKLSQVQSATGSASKGKGAGYFLAGYRRVEGDAKEQLDSDQIEFLRGLLSGQARGQENASVDIGYLVNRLLESAGITSAAPEDYAAMTTRVRNALASNSETGSLGHGWDVKRAMAVYNKPKPPVVAPTSADASSSIHA